jgi:spermidine synthase
MRDEQEIKSRTSWYRWVAFIVFFVSGFAALLYQVIWQRLLVFFSGADVYSVTLIVTTFMAGLGLGMRPTDYQDEPISSCLSRPKWRS